MKWDLWKRLKADNPAQKANKNILKLTYLVAGAFLYMVVYFRYFLQVESGDVTSNAYNTRLSSFANQMVQGRILSNDGTMLAETLVDLDGNEARDYLYGPLFAHVVGHPTKEKTGTGALSNFYLLTSHMNLVGQVVNELSGEKNLGDYVVTTLDVDLRQTAPDALGGRRGAVVVMEPDTGKVSAMISRSEYNPNTLVENWDALTADRNTDAQLVNRATQGSYPPDSTFKLVAALEYIREHLDDYMNYESDRDGYYRQGEYMIKCYHETTHGHQNLKLASVNSCNGVFVNLGLQLNLNRLKGAVEDLLFNQDLPLAIAYNKGSYSVEVGTDTWETLRTSVGQRVTRMTPMLGAMLVSSIADDDALMKLCFLSHVENMGGETVKKSMPAVHGRLTTAQKSTILSDMMWEVVMVGTGSVVRTDAYMVTGKIGSTEFDAKEGTHGWFPGLTPAEDPKLVVSVIVEEGGSGGKVAVPVARAVFDAYLSRWG